jgi:hypothetical protein
MISNESDQLAGMFSKQGRQINQKFLIFQQKNEILQFDFSNPNARSRPAPRKKVKMAPPQLVASQTAIKKVNRRAMANLAFKSTTPPIGYYKPSHGWVEMCTADQSTPQHRDRQPGPLQLLPLAPG